MTTTAFPQEKGESHSQEGAQQSCTRRAKRAQFVSPTHHPLESKDTKRIAYARERGQSTDKGNVEHLLYTEGTKATFLFGSKEQLNG